MNKTVNNFLLGVDKGTWNKEHLLKINKEFKSLKKQEIQDIFTEMN